MVEILTDVPSALWTLDQIEATRVRETPPLVDVVVAIDPMVRKGEATDEDQEEGAETGIVVAGLGEDGHAYVIEDATTRGSPVQRACAAIDAYIRHHADLILGEVNNRWRYGRLHPRHSRAACALLRGPGQPWEVHERAEPISAL